MSIMCTGYIIKMALMAAGSVFIIFMGFSRVYLGAHSYNEVMFGATLGFTLACVLHF
jgi:membrane-associated phospholipid phosphatase